MGNVKLRDYLGTSYFEFLSGNDEDMVLRDVDIERELGIK